MTDEIDKKKERQPKWNREEVVLLVSEYFRTKTMPQNDIDNSIETISATLRTRAKKTNLGIDERYRNITGISMKFGNIKALDREIIDQGYVCLQNANKLEREIVNEYLEDKKKILDEANLVYTKYKG